MLSFKSAGTAGLILALAAGLAGCGNATPSGGESRAASARGVIASASDCVSFGPDAVKACAGAIERAVKAHEASSASYGNIEACEKAVGERRCERAESGKYRARLVAFLVTVGAASARAEPLYPVKDGAVGFRTTGNTTLLASDQSLTFSRLALSLAETQVAEGKKRSRR